MPAKNLCGLDIIFPNDLGNIFSYSTSMGYSFFCCYMFHPKVKRDYKDPNPNRSFPATRSDFLLQQGGDKTFSNSFVGKISPWIDVDSEYEDIRKNSEDALIAELSWAAHLSLPAVSIKLSRQHNPNLARLLINFLAKEKSPFKVWMHIPMIKDEDDNVIPTNSETLKVIDTTEVPCDLQINGDVEPAKESTWSWWREFSFLVSDWSESFCLKLELPASLPSYSEISRWFSEPVASLVVPTKIFLSNRKEYPILSIIHQRLLHRFFKLNVQLVVSGACRHKQGYVAYAQYLNYLWKNQPPATLYEQHATGLEDYLQDPLQPLMDNLCSSTYIIFEMDPYKYKAYENAVYKALLERHSPDINNPDVPVVMVLGAGRGPLVAASFAASDRAKIPIKVYIVEKNPNAVITLQNRVHDEWKERDVTLLSGDMRKQQPSHKADIFVSELLGSFGDNELSPECLDGAQHFLKDNGISIPCSYTSYLAPIQSQKLYREVTKLRDRNKPDYSPFETPYVVHLLNCNRLADPQAAFTFTHPKKDMTEDNSRFIQLTFPIDQDAILHGFAGYFHSVLYSDIDMSIHPDSHSPDMFSWFPLMFPIEKPMSVKAGDKVVIYMWRCVNSRQVWYEWCVTEPQTSRIHNPNGRSYVIGLQA